ncbi:EF hand [compost metagenome]|uniref:EF-hand domain-containing protein n=2 Tax=Cupriavidus campinensis TaxID=151783 RepID=A0ABY3EQK6_9BURK|nr:EF-hand domain-containing protein [Cupriavidus campinensis]
MKLRQIKSDLVNTAYFANCGPLRCLESSPPEYPGFTYFLQEILMSQLRLGGLDSIRSAQEWSSLRHTQATETASANAGAMARFKARGVPLKLVDMVDAFKEDKLKATDLDHDNVVSLSELGKQLAGKSEEELSKIHKAMDVDKDGQVSATEFKDSMPLDEYFNTADAAGNKGELMARFSGLRTGIFQAASAPWFSPSNVVPPNQPNSSDLLALLP